MRIFIFLLPLIFSFLTSAHAVNYCTNGQLGAGWLFDEPSGLSFSDCTANANTGTGTSVVAGATGKYSLAIATTDIERNYVTVSPATSINALTTMSLGGWINPNSAGYGGNNCSGATLIGKLNGSAHGPQICINTDGSFTFTAYWSGGNASWKSSVTPILTGVWQHLAVTYSFSSSSNTPTFYYNGILVGNTVVNAPSGSPQSDALNTVYIGNEQGPSGNGGFDGDLDEVFIGNVVFSSTDISNIYTHGLQGIYNLRTSSTLINAVIKNATNI